MYKKLLPPKIIEHADLRLVPLWANFHHGSIGKLHPLPSTAVPVLLGMLDEVVIWFNLRLLWPFYTQAR
jgi:hypothetical protein